jgi:hypothetical protein
MAEKKMTAPPSTAKRIVEVPEMFQALIDARGTKGRFVGSDEVDSPWVPIFGGVAFFRSGIKEFYCAQPKIQCFISGTQMA